MVDVMGGLPIKETSYVGLEGGRGEKVLVDIGIYVCMYVCMYVRMYVCM